MSKPAGMCVFCGGPKLTKGHIWPKSFGSILPSDAIYHEQKIGEFYTFKSDIPGPPKWERVGTGPLQKRRPRNTCVTCNGGWMSLVEAAALPAVEPLILGERSLLDLPAQWALANVFTLISTRIEFTAQGMATIPALELEALRANPLASDSWKIWIARHAGDNLKDYQYRYTAIQIEDDPSAPHGAEYCNTHVTTLVVGQLYAHIFFSTVWPDFPGYEADLTQIWPPITPYIDTSLLPEMPDAGGVMVHEAISREGKRPKA
jgi:hypothetical protein